MAGVQSNGTVQHQETSAILSPSTTTNYMLHHNPHATHVSPPTKTHCPVQWQHVLAVEKPLLHRLTTHDQEQSNVGHSASPLDRKYHSGCPNTAADTHTPLTGGERFRTHRPGILISRPHLSAKPRSMPESNNTRLELPVLHLLPVS